MNTVLKYPGSKWRLADWIVSYMPPHTTYLELFAGSLAVFFNKPPSAIETVNDIDGNVVNLFRVLREMPDELAELISMTPWARDEYFASYETTGDALENARRFLVRCWQAFGTKTHCRTGWRNDVQGRRFAYCVSEWNDMPARIRAMAVRLKNAQIENEDALKLIKRYKYQNVLIYADPPYVLASRNTKKQYAFEMTDTDHTTLLDALEAHPGPVLLSGYACDLYDKRLKRWQRVTKQAQAEKGQKRTEVLWINKAAQEGQQVLRF